MRFWFDKAKYVIKTSFQGSLIVTYDMLDNKLNLYFPQFIQQLGWILNLFGVLMLIKAIPMPNPLVPMGAILIGLVLSLTSRGTRLDLDHMRFKRYVGLFGLKLGSWQSLPKLEQIVFTSNNYSQQIHSIVSRKSLNTKEFRAFIKGNNCKILFSAGKDAQSVKQDAHMVASRLSLPAIDYTVKPPASI